MDLTIQIEKLKEEIRFISEGCGISQAILYAKDKNLNLNFGIPNHLWPEIEDQVEEEYEDENKM